MSNRQVFSDYDTPDDLEVLGELVLPAVFKTVGLYEKHAVGGFDSHALPLAWAISRAGGEQQEVARFQALTSCLLSSQMADTRTGVARRQNADPTNPELLPIQLRVQLKGEATEHFPGLM